MNIDKIPFYLRFMLIILTAITVGCSSKAKSAEVRISIFSENLEEFFLDVGRYPSNEEGMIVLLSAPHLDKEKWQGPYLNYKELPKDPWGNSYVYRVRSKQGCYEIYSFGINLVDDGGLGDDIYYSSCTKREKTGSVLK